MSGTEKTNREARLFSEKLLLIMRVTGCETQKTLFSRIKAVNPETGYDPIRAYKWAQGRSSPRNKAIYDDLALLLDLDVGGERLRTCSYPAFHALLAEKFGAKVPPLRDTDLEVEESADSAAEGGAAALPGYLLGRYCSISRAWSPHKSGMLLIGITEIVETEAGSYGIEYLEHLPWSTLRVSGPVRRIGRNINAPVISGDSEVSINFTYTMPPAPGAVLAGVMSGVTMSDTEMRPVAGRVLSLRLPDGGGSEQEISGYLDLRAEEIAARLRICGFSAGQADTLAPDVLDFLVQDGDRGVIEAPVAAVNTLIGKVLG